MINSSIKYKQFTFPAGEMHIQLLDAACYSQINIEWIFTKNEDIIELLLYCNALKEKEIKLHQLTIPYLPFGRQDRVAVDGEAFSLKVFCQLVNSLGAERVVVYDPHSDVIPALLERCKVIHQHQIFAPLLNDVYDDENFFLISPDGGALKKIYKLSPLLNMCDGVIECSKLRDVKTGAITETKVHLSMFDFRLECSTCVIVDDICDGGRTFIEIAKILKEKFLVKRVALCVTHGLFTKGMEVFDGIIDDIFTRNGRVK